MSNGNCTITLVTNVNSAGRLVTTDFPVWLTSFQTQTQTQFTSNQVHQGLSWSPVRRSEQTITFTIDWPLQTVGTTKGQYDYNGFRAMNAFQNALRFHQKLAATTNTFPPPMNFLYYNNFVGSYVDQNNVVTTITTTSGNGNSLIDNNLASILDYSSTSNGVYNATTPVNSTQVLQPIQYQGWVTQVQKQYDRFKSVYSMQYQMNVLTPLQDSVDLPSAIIASTINSTTKYLRPTPGLVFSEGKNWVSAQITMGNGINISGIPG